MDPSAPQADPLPGLQLESVSRWLSTHASLHAPLQFERVGRGRSNLTFSVTDAAGARLVLRRPPLGSLLESAHDMAREYRVLSALAGEAIPVPGVIAMCSDLAVTAAPFYVMRHVDGAVIDSEESGLALDARARAGCGPALARALARIHSVPIDAVGLGDLGKRDEYAQRQLRRWGRRWKEVARRPVPQIDAVEAKLTSDIPPQREVCLVHGDFNLANAVLTSDGSIAAVLDWELCTLGDPVADLATLLCYWPDTAAQAVPDRDPVPLLEGFAHRSELVASYSDACPDRDLSTLGWWLTLATWKLAIILEGVHRRSLENFANGGVGTEGLGAAVERLAETAGELASQGFAI